MEIEKSQQNQKVLIPPVPAQYNLKQIAKGTYNIFRVIKQGEDESKCKVIIKAYSHTHKQHIQECKNLKREFQMGVDSKHQYVNIFHKFEQLENDKVHHCVIQMKNQPSDLYKQLQQSFPNLDCLKVIKQFQQLAEALQNMHEKNICHFDLKPENVALDAQSNVQLIDFGFSFNVTKITLDDMQSTWERRSLLYLAPEIMKITLALEKKKLQNQDIQGMDWKMIDIFAFGVTMFSCLFYSSPLKCGRASRNDELYSLIFTKQYEQFWKKEPQTQHFLNIIRNTLGQEVSEMIIILFQGMIAYDPNERPTAEEINLLLTEICTPFNNKK